LLVASKEKPAVHWTTRQNIAAVRDPKDEICRMSTKAETTRVILPCRLRLDGHAKIVGLTKINLCYTSFGPSLSGSSSV
jgi:hypothetical protein